MKKTRTFKNCDTKKVPVRDKCLNFIFILDDSARLGKFWRLLPREKSAAAEEKIYDKKFARKIAPKTREKKCQKIAQIFSQTFVVAAPAPKCSTWNILYIQFNATPQF